MNYTTEQLDSLLAAIEAEIPQAERNAYGRGDYGDIELLALHQMNAEYMKDHIGSLSVLLSIYTDWRKSTGDTTLDVYQFANRHNARLAGDIHARSEHTARLWARYIGENQ